MGKHWSEALAQEQLLIVVQVDGKVRGKLTVPSDIDQNSLEAQALTDPKVKSFIVGKKVRRVFYVPGRLVNIVLEG